MLNWQVSTPELIAIALLITITGLICRDQSNAFLLNYYLNGRTYFRYKARQKY